MLVLLFTFLGLPWLFLITLFAVIGFRISTTNVVIFVTVLIDVLQGPALFVIRVVRLREARQFWKQLLCKFKFARRQAQN